MLLRTGTFPIEEHNFSLLGKNNLINKPTFKTIFFFFYKILKSILTIWFSNLMLDKNLFPTIFHVTFKSLKDYYEKVL